ncbi:hypothetical protein MHI24_19885 [Paenibacillus sp. FSL K6-1096]|uniref:hypothetical protein n=1 Tax=Paenibacillus sp. FSL K6-1096 TaxID=2921460 RepID=UPI0030ECF9B8
MMGSLLSNKKRIRGWKRRVKQIDQWKKWFMHLDLEELQTTQRDYVKLWIDPFYRLNRRNPPVWYSRLLLEAMIEVYHSWSRQMAGLNEPFYLRIWFYHPNFIQSQIVVAFRDALHFYDNTFEAGSGSQTFPWELYGTVSGLQDFIWEPAAEPEPYCLPGQPQSKAAQVWLGRIE